MLDSKFFDNISKELASLIPKDAAKTGEDLQKNIKSLLQSSLSKLELVTREEFDIQRQVLKRTREKLEAVEKQLANLNT